MLNALRKLAVVALATAAALSGVASSSPLAERAADRLVFCHFMIGIVSDRTSANDYDDDMRRAKAAGIDAFALNIGVDGYTDQQLGYAYDSAARNGMHVFLSFDFNWWKPADDAAAVGRKIAQYKDRPAQLRVDNRVFVSSFAGDGLDVDAMRGAAAGDDDDDDVYFVPNFHPGQSASNKVDGALNWMGWPSDGHNKAPKKDGRTVSVADGDDAYQSWLGGKTYLAPVSPWFFTHYGPEVSFSKNWVFPGGSLLFDRWNEVLQKGFPMVEIITWNDYGESHYVGPLSSPHYDDGNSKWTNDMQVITKTPPPIRTAEQRVLTNPTRPHDGWLDLSKPFIKAYKAGATSVDNFIDNDQIVYWYRRTLASLDCDATDTTSGRPANNASGNYYEGRPDGWQTMPDVVYVASLLQSPGTVTVTSGGQTRTESAPAGAHLFSVAAGVGPQTFGLSRGGATIMQETSLMDIASVCPCGLYNFNAYVGTVPRGPGDALLASDGLASLTVGLRVSTCQAKPSLGTNPPVSTPPGNPGTTPTSSSSSSPANPPPTSTPTSGGQVCVEGTVADGESGNYTGLCQFSCNYGYCPRGPCKCTRYGGQVGPPPETGARGCPLEGEADGYKGLCSYACNHGYCPDTACRKC